MSKVLQVDALAALIPDGASIMIGGFMGVGSPLRMIDALIARGARDLTIIANDTAHPGFAIGKLIDAGCVSKVIASHIGLNPVTQKAMIAGDIAVELVPQGTLAERIRAGGFGLGGILTATGIGTVVEDGKQVIESDGEVYLLEKPLKADFALVKAKTADHGGNLEYSLTARNFNPMMPMAAATVIAEVDHIVPLGGMPPDNVVTPGVLVDYLVAKEASHG